MLIVNDSAEKSGLPKMAAMSGVIRSADEGRHQRAEGGADDDRDRQVDDVAPQDELLEAFEHGAPSSVEPTGRPREARRRNDTSPCGAPGDHRFLPADRRPEAAAGPGDVAPSGVTVGEPLGDADADAVGDGAASGAWRGVTVCRVAASASPTPRRYHRNAWPSCTPTGDVAAAVGVEPARRAPRLPPIARRSDGPSDRTTSPPWSPAPTARSSPSPCC